MLFSNYTNRNTQPRRQRNKAVAILAKLVVPSAIGNCSVSSTGRHWQGHWEQNFFRKSTAISQSSPTPAEDDCTNCVHNGDNTRRDSSPEEEGHTYTKGFPAKPTNRKNRELAIDSGYMALIDTCAWTTVICKETLDNYLEAINVQSIEKLPPMQQEHKLGRDGNARQTLFSLALPFCVMNEQNEAVCFYCAN